MTEIDLLPIYDDKYSNPSGAFRKHNDKNIMIINLELNAEHPQYNKLYNEITTLLDKNRKIPSLILSSSGV